MIRGRKRPLEKVPEVKANLNCSIHNRFDIEVIDTATGEIKQKAQAENVVCNQLWTRLFTPGTYFNYIHYGAGTGTPSSTDVSLFAFLGYDTPLTIDDVYSYDWNSGVASIRRKIQLSETTAVGATLTEVGIGYGPAASFLVTHAMLKDMNGNQISIIKTGTDIINIYATVFAHWAAAGYDSENLKIMPTPSRSSAEDQYGGFIFFLCGMYDTGKGRYLPTGICYDATNYPSNGKGIMFPPSSALSVTWTYNTATKTITSSIPRLTGATGNALGGITRAVFSYVLGGYNLYAPLIAMVDSAADWYSGSNVVGEAIGTGDGVTTDYSTDFGYVTNADIYVDGLKITSGVTVDELSPANRKTGYLGQLNQINASGNPFLQRPMELSAPRSVCFENPNYATIGITNVTIKYAYVYMSDDLTTWIKVADSSDRTFVSYTIPSAYKNYRYMKIVGYGSSYSDGAIVAVSSDAATDANIHFTTPPAVGAVITADYFTQTIAKDANHVFDLTVTIQLGEKTI